MAFMCYITSRLTRTNISIEFFLLAAESINALVSRLPVEVRLKTALLILQLNDALGTVAKFWILEPLIF